MAKHLQNPQPSGVASQLNSLPKTPGIYKFLDNKKSVLYVGKAKNLRSRVQSYFKQNAELSLAKQDMMMRVSDIQTIQARTEDEALVLEAMNIKKYKPRYNVALKDDKDYSFVKIDMNLEYPIVTIVRRPRINDTKQKFFGPFTSAYALNENLRFLRRIFPYRKRHKALTKFEKDLLEKRSIGAVPESQKEYADMIKRLIKIIDGHTAAVQKDLKKKMLILSNQKDYEQAAKVRNQIKWLDIFANRQKIVSAKEYLEQSISSRQRGSTDALSASLPSALSASLEEIKRALKLKTLPHRIEGYDISNISGQFAVGSMVVFTNGEPDKKEYRKFKIKTVKGADDFASIAEVLQRRLKHHGWKRPDLILLDGGKGQLSVIINTLFNKEKLTAYGLRLTAFQIIALAKKQEELYQGARLTKINLDPLSGGSMLLQRVRDEAHRFAQKYYHTLHSKSYAKNKIGKTGAKKAQ